MSEKFFITTYDRSELISTIREAFGQELKESPNQQEKEIEYNVLLNKKEVAEMLKVSLITIRKYKKSGKLKYYRLGRLIYFKKGEVMEALQLPIKYRRWNDPRFVR